MGEGGVSRIWQADGRIYYDELVFDDIRVGLEGFHPTKEISDPHAGPYHNQQNESAKYRRMRHVTYRYETGTGKLYRQWIEGASSIICVEEVLYAHFQKRILTVENINPTKDFWIVPNKFIAIPDNCSMKMYRKLSPSKYAIKDIIKIAKNKIRSY